MKDEIVGRMGDKLRGAYDNISSLELSEPEMANLMTVFFLELSGSTRY